VEELRKLIEARLESIEPKTLPSIVPLVVLGADGAREQLHIDPSNDTLVLRPGPPARTGFDLTARLEDWVDLFEGLATARACLIDGRLEIEGDLGLAMRALGVLFP
jgi:hypothetical protein